MSELFDDSSAQILVNHDGAKRRRQEKRLSRVKVTMFAAMLAVAVIAIIAAIFFGAQYASASARVAELESTSAEARQQTGDAEARIAELESAVAEKDATIATQEELLASREGFLTTLGEAAALLDEARPKVDVSGFERTVSAEQDRVAAERENPAVVANSTATVRDAMNVLRTEVQEYDAEQERLRAEQEQQELEREQREGLDPNEEPPPTPDPSANTNAAPATDPVLAGARSALDAVGGGWVHLERADIVCEMAAAIACAHPDGRVIVANRVAGNSKGYWMGPMAHEYAHQIQFKNYWALIDSPTLAALFTTGNAGLELLADCMAKVIVPTWRGPYQADCDGDEMAFAQRVWNGAVA
jgi:cell division protein FtsL